MLSSLLLTAAVACAEHGASAQPAPVLELVVRIQDTRLAFFNPTERTELLVLGDAQHRARATLAVAPGAAVELRCNASALAGLELAVLARGDDGLHASPPVTFDALRGSDRDRTACLVSCADHVHVWFQIGAAWSLLDGGPDAGAPHAYSAPRAIEPVHVPVITPDDSRRGDLPPRLEKNPLPPV